MVASNNFNRAGPPFLPSSRPDAVVVQDTDIGAIVPAGFVRASLLFTCTTQLLWSCITTLPRQANLTKSLTTLPPTNTAIKAASNNHHPHCTHYEKMVLSKRPASSDFDDSIAPLKKRSNWTDILTIVVGKSYEQETFRMHEHHICSRSKFFHSKCSQLAGSGEKVIRLRDGDVVCFQQYMECMYNDAVDFEALIGCETVMIKGVRKAKTPEAGKAAVLSMCKLWDHAYYLRDGKLKNNVMDGLIRMVSVQGFAIGLEAIKFVGRYTKPGTALRRWLVDSLAPTLQPKALELCGNEYPSSIVMELLTKCAEIIGSLGGRNKGTPQLVDCIAYHENDDVEIVREGRVGVH